MSDYDNPQKTLDDQVADAVRKAVKNHIGSEKFKDEAKKEYQTQITGLIEAAEKKARNWAIIVALLVTGIAFVLVFSEFLKVREKRLSIDEEYVKVLSTAQELHKTIDTLKTDVDRLKGEVEASDKSTKATFESLEKKARELEAQIRKTDKL
ncbi:hypothetical protein [Methylobacter svalbardensis]|uniref:hypothetical protein n=1 Tax=Methylobacter svalbardensis TaxID=3080016 RepID=UPI0030ECE932